MKVRRSARPLCLAISVLLFGFWQHVATAQLLGPEFQVNSYTTGWQRFPAVAADVSGNFVVVWNQSSPGYGLVGKRYDPTGIPLGGEFQINTYTTTGGSAKAVGTDGSGNFVVVWENNGQDGSNSGIFGRRFDSAGTPAGSAFQVNSYTPHGQYAPALAVGTAGNFVVVWGSYGGQDGSLGGVFGQRFDSAGSRMGSEFRVNSYTTGRQWAPAVAAGSSGDFVVVWQSYLQDGSLYGVFGRRFDSAGTPAGSDFQVNSYTTGGQYYPSVAANSSGNFVVVWMSRIQDGAEFGVFGKRYDSLGVPQGGEFQVNTYTTGSQQDPSVAADSWGNFLVAWRSNPQDGSFWGVSGQRFDSAGTPLGSEFQVNSYTTSHQYHQALAADGSGNFVVAWESYLQDGSGTAIVGRQMTVQVPDLVVIDPSTSISTLPAGEGFSAFATVQNAGAVPSTATTLTYYLSADSTIATSDASLGQDSIPGLAPAETSPQELATTAPPTNGTYWVGACVALVPDEMNTANNCSAGVEITVYSAPDLVVTNPSVSASIMFLGEAFTAFATAQNAGNAVSTSTTMTYFLSSNSTITTGDSPLGQDSIPGLAGGATSAQNLATTAPLTAGTYWVGACVAPVPGELSTSNNCSTGVQITVLSHDVFADGFEPGDACAWSAAVGGGC